jgi:hypothetical protein
MKQLDLHNHNMDQEHKIDGIVQDARLLPGKIAT